MKFKSQFSELNSYYEISNGIKCLNFDLIEIEDSLYVLWNASCLQREWPGAESILSAHNYVNNVPVNFIVQEGTDIDQADVKATEMAALLPVVRTPKE